MCNREYKELQMFTLALRQSSINNTENILYIDYVTMVIWNRYIYMSRFQITIHQNENNSRVRRFASFVEGSIFLR